METDDALSDQQSRVFTAEELLLSRVAWARLVEVRRESLLPVCQKWLRVWETQREQAGDLLEAEEQWMRLGHYSGWLGREAISCAPQAVAGVY